MNEFIKDYAEMTPMEFMTCHKNEVMKLIAKVVHENKMQELK